MKITKIKEDLQVMDVKQLLEKKDLWKRELFTLKLNSQTSNVKNYAQYKFLRKNIARALSFVREKELAVKQNV